MFVDRHFRVQIVNIALQGITFMVRALISRAQAKVYNFQLEVKGSENKRLCPL